MSDNPFTEPEDDNRTVIRPTPGRRRSQSAAPPVKEGGEPTRQEPRAAARPAALAEGTEDTAIGEDALAAAAADEAVALVDTHQERRGKNMHAQAGGFEDRA